MDLQHGLRTVRSLTFMGVLSIAALSPVQAEEITQHARLGFSGTIPINASRGEVIEDPVFGADIASYSVSLNGSATVTVDLGADYKLTFDPAQIVPGGTMNLQLTYTPTDDSGPEFRLNSTANLDFDASIIGIDIGDGNVNLTLAAGSADFLSPLGSDPAVVVPLTSSTVTLSTLGIDLASAKLDGDITLSPTPSGALPGLGGSAAVLTVQGATLVSPTLVPGVGIIEWQSAGATQNITLQLPAGGTPNIQLNLQPALHWLGTAASAQINIDLQGPLDIFPEPDPIPIITGSLGPLYSEIGLDTLVGDLITDTVGFDPGVAARIGAGFVPIPLLSPEIATLDLSGSSTPSLGSVLFSIDADADDDGLLDGEEAALGTGVNDPDSDDDGLLDGAEVHTNNTDPLDSDTDNDGLSDGAEVNTHHTNPLDSDTDNDGLTDGTEVLGANPTDPLDADSDNDGLSDGAEDANLNGQVDAGETNPNDADSDDDGLTDGAEVNTHHTDPLDADTDNDGLTDGIEVNGANPTNPLDADSDDDGLMDGVEDANGNGQVDSGETNPNVADTDSDGLNDGTEVATGTDPLDADSDDDGIPDGSDVEFLQNTLNALANEAFKSAGPGLKNATLAHLENIEAQVAAGRIAQAIRELEQLRSRVDGCGAAADNNDWITDCAAQTTIRGYIDLLIANLSA